MKLTTDQVKKVAQLANLPLSENEVEMSSQQLSEILDYVDQLNRVQNVNVNPTYNITGLENVMEEDVSTPSLDQKEAVANAPFSKDGLFVTKGIFDNE